MYNCVINNVTMLGAACNNNGLYQIVTDAHDVRNVQSDAFDADRVQIHSTQCQTQPYTYGSPVKSVWIYKTDI